MYTGEKTFTGRMQVVWVLVNAPHSASDTQLSSAGIPVHKLPLMQEEH